MLYGRLNDGDKGEHQLFMEFCYEITIFLPIMREAITSPIYFLDPKKHR